VQRGIVSVQVGSALAKHLFDEVGSFGTVALRLFFAAAVLMLVWRPSLRIDRGTWTVVLGYGVVLGAMNLCFYSALARLPLGIAVTIEFLGPLAVALAGSRRWLDAFWAVLAAGGVVLLTEGGGELDLLGVLFALADGLNVQHAFRRAGAFTVRVTAADAVGNTATAARRVTIRPARDTRPPRW
jgi:inner membrane transporter RhtA